MKKPNMFSRNYDIALALQKARTWTNWPQINRLTLQLADILELDGGEKANFIAVARAYKDQP